MALWKAGDRQAAVQLNEPRDMGCLDAVVNAVISLVACQKAFD